MTSQLGNISIKDLQTLLQQLQANANSTNQGESKGTTASQSQPNPANAANTGDSVPVGDTTSKPHKTADQTGLPSSSDPASNKAPEKKSVPLPHTPSDEEAKIRDGLLAGTPSTRGARTARLIQIYQLTNEIKGAVNPEAYAVIDYLCHVANYAKIEPQLPGKDAGFQEIGRALNLIQFKIVDCGSNLIVPHVLLDDINEAQAEHNLDLMVNDPVVAAVFRAELARWQSNVGAYEEKRKASARKRLVNDGFNQNEITAKLNDTKWLRQSAAASTKELRKRLEAIDRKSKSSNPFDRPTTSELKLLQKHASWFGKSQESVTDYMPNDAAVNYTVMLYELIKLAADNCADDVLVTRNHILAILTNWKRLSASQTSWDAWAQMSVIGTYVVEGCDIGKAMATYAGQGNRVSEKGLKLAPAHLRRPQILDRLADDAIGTGKWSIINLRSADLVAKIRDLALLEWEAAALILVGVNVAGGADGYSVAGSLAWYTACSKSNFYMTLSGRNDLSGPTVIAEKMGVGDHGMPDMPAREWSWPKTYHTCITNSYFPGQPVNNLELFRNLEVSSTMIQHAQPTGFRTRDLKLTEDKAIKIYNDAAGVSLAEVPQYYKGHTLLPLMWFCLPIEEKKKMRDDAKDPTAFSWLEVRDGLASAFPAMLEMNVKVRPLSPVDVIGPRGRRNSIIGKKGDNSYSGILSNCTISYREHPW